MTVTESQNSRLLMQFPAINTRTLNRIAVGCLFLLLSIFAEHGLAQDATIDNVILVTLDGLRWQELFSGAESKLIDKDIGKVRDVGGIRKKFWHKDPVQRRKLLMPRFWQMIENEGQVFGSPDHDSTTSVKNKLHFSYPGYNELLCGCPDPKIISNSKTYNKNVTVLEWLNQMPEFKDRVAAFCSWDVFPFIINDKRSGVYVNAGWQRLEIFENDAALKSYSMMESQLPRYWNNVRYDAFTYRGAVEYLKVIKPRVLYLALGETDDWAHDGRYDLYLESAKVNDQMISDLWDLVQSIPQYKNKTAMVISTDHGRGDGREGWKNHNFGIAGSDKIWIAVHGPGIKAMGIRSNVNCSQGQVASTVAWLLGKDLANLNPEVAMPLPLQK